MTDKLQLIDLSKAYGANTVVDRLNLTLRSGEFISLLGPSGCGKTTTLRMIAGFVAPTAGSIMLDGQRLSSPQGSLPPEKRRMSMIFQSYALWPNMTVAQNVAFGLKMRKVPRADIQRRVAEMLDVVRLKALAERYPNELSGGQQQRVSLARALVVKPEVLLLDEPLSNLDANLREEMRSEIRRLHNEFGITSIYVTHDQAEAMTTSDRVAVMNEGRIEQLDDPLTLYNRPSTRYVAEFIGRSNILHGRVDGVRVAFDGFDIPAGLTATNLYSLRPQHVRLGTTTETISDHAIVRSAQVLARSFLGESWDYTLRLDGGLSLRASTQSVHDAAIGQTVSVAIDPINIVPLQPDPRN